MRRPAFPWRCVCGTSKKQPPLQGREGLIDGRNLPPRGGGKAMRPRRAHHARKAPRRTPPQRERVGTCLGVSAGESGDAARRRKVSLGKGKKFQALGRRRRERARERGDASAAPMEESLEREREGGREGGRARWVW
nr:unnamed protein product [Digitaria exilis]